MFGICWRTSQPTPWFGPPYELEDIWTELQKNCFREVINGREGEGIIREVYNERSKVKLRSQAAGHDQVQ